MVTHDPIPNSGGVAIPQTRRVVAYDYQSYIIMCFTVVCSRPVLPKMQNLVCQQKTAFSKIGSFVVY